MSRRRAIIFVPVLLIAVVLVWGSWRQSTGYAAGENLSTVPTTQPIRPSLRLATFNIDGGEGTDGKTDLARTARCFAHPDLVVLNEVHAPLFGPQPNQAQILGQLLHLPFLYVPAEHRWWHDSFGNAFLCDLPVIRWERIVLPNAPFHARRNYLLARIAWQDQTVHLLATHVDWKTGGDEQLNEVIKVFLEQPVPAILMGDLNHPPGDPIIQHLKGTEGVEESISTILGTEEKPRVDWIFIRGLKTLDAGSVDIGASDHPAFWAEVALK